MYEFKISFTTHTLYIKPILIVQVVINRLHIAILYIKHLNLEFHDDMQIIFV